MRFSLAALFGVVTIVCVVLGLCSRLLKTDDYYQFGNAAVFYLPTGETERLAHEWLIKHDFKWARIPADLRENYSTCRQGGRDADYVRCLSTYRSDEVKGLPVYASLCIAPVDEHNSILRVEFESRFRTSKFYASRLTNGRELLGRLSDDLNAWLPSEARRSGVSQPELAVAYVRVKPQTAAGTQYELQKHLSQHVSTPK